jgi:hypothetical protein
MRKFFLQIGIIFFYLVTILASPIDEYSASKVATNFYMAISKSKFKSSIELTLAYKCISKQTSKLKSGSDIAYYYVFNDQNKGFVIVSGNDATTPILGYSLEGSFNPDSIPDVIENWLKGYEEQIQIITENNLSTDSTAKAEWNSLLKSSLSGAASSATIIVNNLVNTTWNQNKYYNKSCPTSANAASDCSGRVYAGCVATAMAQIMKYWSYPTQGISSHSYSHSTYGYLTGYFSSTTYDWNAMPTYLTSSNDEVATIMYHAGVSVDMNYGTSGSSAAIFGSTKSTECALKTYFGYKKTLYGVSYSNYTSQAWSTLIKHELDSLRPIIYRGENSSSDGHAFILDGYDNNNNFHFNWGWGGSYDGWFRLSLLNPGTHDYTTDQAALIGIEPDRQSIPSSGSLSIYPKNATNWTGSAVRKADGTYTKYLDDVFIVGEVSSNWYVGWVSFDISQLPKNAKFSNMVLHFEMDLKIPSGYIYNLHLKGPNCNPFTASAKEIWNGYAGEYLNSSFKPTLVNATTLNTDAENDLKDAVKSLSESFNICFANESYDNIACCMYGHNSSKKPYITLDYEVLTLNISKQSMNFESPASSATFTITSNQNWMLTKNETWFNIDKTEGYGNTTITVTVNKNTTSSLRDGKIRLYLEGQDPRIVEGVVINVSQKAEVTLSVSTNTLTIASAANSTKIFDITSNISWTASVNQSWLKVSSSSGSNSATITLTVEANPSTTKRTATIEISGTGVSSQTITVTQDGALPVLNVSSNNLSITASENSINTFNITSNINWSIVSSQTWLKISSSNGSNNSAITLTAQANSTFTKRSATITISGTGVTSKKITVTQDGITPELSVSSSTLSIAALENSTITFNINSNISWSVASNQTWLKISSSSGSNNATITLTAKANTSSTKRTATVTISGTGATSQTITITQVEKPVLKISSNTLAVKASSNSTIAFSITSNINWAVSSNQAWLTSSKTSGSGNTTVTLTASANVASSTRTATVTVSGTGVTAKTITITQDAAASVLTVSTNALTIASAANSKKTFDIASNISWAISSSQSWLTASKTSGAGNATITLSAVANTSATKRTASVSVSGTGVTAQTITVTQDAGTSDIIITENSDLSIYPNPVDNVLFLVGVPKNVEITIFNISGKTVISTKSNGNQIDISMLSKGIYIIRIIDSKNVKTKEFIKK